MGYDFDTVLDRRNTACEKWDDLISVFGTSDVLPLWVADMDFATPPAIRHALARRLDHPTYGYTYATGNTLQAVRGWLRRKHSWEVDPEWIVFCPGVVPSLAMSVLAYSAPGDGVVVQSPVYPPFFTVIEANGRRVLNNQLVNVNGRYEIDWVDLEAKLGQGARVMLLCSPANPVGRVWTEQELARIIHMCADRGVVLVSDEIHCDVVYSGCRHIPASSLGEQAWRNSVTLMSSSKTFNIQGLNTSFAVIPDSRLRKAFMVAQSAVGGAQGNTFGLVALEAAFTQCDHWHVDLVEYLEGNRDYLECAARRSLPGIVPVRAEGMYVVWLDCRGLGLSDEELRSFFVKRARVGLNDGRMFGPGGEGFARLNIGCARSVLAEGMSRIASALNSAS